MSNRTRRAIWIAIVAASLVGLGVYWFGPQRLFTDRVADEALPTPTVENPTATDTEPGADGPSGGGTTTLAEGAFRSLEHETTGSAALLTTADGTFLRIEDLDSLDGPDLRVFLTSAPADGEPGSFGAEALVADLGELRANQGNLTYQIPGGVDLDDVRSVAIWCRRFSVGFGVAALEPTR